MDSAGLRELQAPLKEKYRNDPDARLSQSTQSTRTDWLSEWDLNLRVVESIRSLITCSQADLTTS